MMRSTKAPPEVVRKALWSTTLWEKKHGELDNIGCSLLQIKSKVWRHVRWFEEEAGRCDQVPVGSQWGHWRHTIWIWDSSYVKEGAKAVEHGFATAIWCFFPAVTAASSFVCGSRLRQLPRGAINKDKLLGCKQWPSHCYTAMIISQEWQLEYCKDKKNSNRISKSYS